MTYNLKDVFYLGAVHQYKASDYGTANDTGIIPIDVSAYVDPIAKGRQRGQGLAIYKVHCLVSGDNVGGPFASADVGSAVIGLSVKPYTESGDNSSAIQMGDLSCDSDLLIWGAHAWAPASLVPGQGGMGPNVYIEPSEDVPYVAVRDTIFQLLETEIGFSTNDDWYVSYRLECAMITLDTATLNQLLRTQTA